MSFCSRICGTRVIKRALAHFYARLAGAPLLLTLLLTIALWWWLNNIVVALLLGLLLSCLLTMVHGLLNATAIPILPADVTPMSADAYTLVPCPGTSVGLPKPDADALTQVAAMHVHMHQCIAASGGFLPFDQWMHQALYAPGLGYYMVNAKQFPAPAGTRQGNNKGDFTTAPELTPLFGRSLATQVAQVLRESGSLHILEFGAGSGALAASLIPALRNLGIEPHYHILEVSTALRQRQQARLAPLRARVQWRDTLPQHFIGCVIANEVLDAMPASLLRWDEQGHLMELGVVAHPSTAFTQQSGSIPEHPQGPQCMFALAQRPASQHLRDLMTPRMPPLPGYRTECNPQAETWVRQLGAWLDTGVVLLIDYGFSRREYYHPQRAEGTLMCHLRHHAHADPLIYPGLQDITTHVDFTAMADAALHAGLEILGYTTQAHFLMNCGIVTHLAQTRSNVPTQQEVAQSHAVQTLLSEAEMGELFKVLALGRGINTPLLGFVRGDRSASL